MSWSDAVDQALCFGWIDSKKIRVDAETSHQFFSKRRAKSTWSKVNKDKIERLTAGGFMMAAGLQAVALAKENGSWNMLDEVEALIVPIDLQLAFRQNPGTEAAYLQLSKSNKKIWLAKLAMSKRPETRAKWVAEIVGAMATKKMGNL